MHLVYMLSNATKVAAMKSPGRIHGRKAGFASKLFLHVHGGMACHGLEGSTNQKRQWACGPRVFARATPLFNRECKSRGPQVCAHFAAAPDKTASLR